MANYFLHVDILVRDINSNAFEELVKKVCGNEGTFGRNNWKLLLGLRSQNTCQYQRSGREGLLPTRVLDVRTSDTAYRRFVNVWDLPEPADIATVMQQLADNSDYSNLHTLIVREIQNQLILIDGLTSAVVPSVGDTYVEIQRNVPIPFLADYLFNSGILVPSFTSIGWKNFGSFQFVTGHTDGLVEFWGAPPEATKANHSDAQPGPRNLAPSADPTRKNDLWDIAEHQVAATSQTNAGSGPIRGVRPDNVLAELRRTLSAEWRDQLQVYFAPRGSL